MVLNNVSTEVANAIATAYPSPGHLMEVRFVKILQLCWLFYNNYHLIAHNVKLAVCIVTKLFRFI